MLLASFGDVYECYRRIVESERKSADDDFPHQPYKLLETYAKACDAVENVTNVVTSIWERQSGASTTALALAMCAPDAIVLTADFCMAQHQTNRLFRAFPNEANNVRKNTGAARISSKLWYMTALDHRMIAQHPKLVIVDSECAYRKERDAAVRDVQRYVNCAVVVLDGPEMDWII